MSRYYIIEKDCDHEFFRGPFSSIASARAAMKREMANLYQFVDRPLRDILDENGDATWSSAEYIIVEEVECLKVTPKVKIQIDLTTV